MSGSTSCRAWSVVAGFGLAASACTTETVLVRYAPRVVSPTVELLEIGGVYNVTLLQGAKAPVLVDTGPEEAFDDLRAALTARGVAPEALGLLIVTHGHSDHAGAARAFQQLGVPVLVHAGDAPMLRSGDHGALYATNLEAVLAQPFIASRYPALEPDIVMTGDGSYALDAYGIRGEIRHVGGHTAGSIVVRLYNGGVIVGDLVRGGWLGGAVDRDRPAHHLFHAYPAEQSMEVAEDFVRRLAACPDVKIVFVGHGGPIGIDALGEWAGDAKGACPW